MEEGACVVIFSSFSKMCPSQHILFRWQIGVNRGVTTALRVVGLETLGAHKKRPGRILETNRIYLVLRNTAITREDLFPLRLC